MGGIVKSVTDLTGGLVSGVLGGDKPPAITPTPAPAAPADPTNTSANPDAAAARNAAAEEERRKRAGSGRASTIFTGALGDTSGAGVSAQKVLLGM